jgi:signal peptidase I
MQAIPSWKRWKLLRVRGNSMAPTLRNGQTIQTRPFTGLTAGYTRLRCSLVALQHPLNNKAIYLKRVIGLPNEHIAIVDGRVMVDGILLEEPYLPENMETHSRGASQWFTDAAELFVLGDNRADSEDSRVFGPVPSESIVGEVWFRYLPPAFFSQELRIG